MIEASCQENEKELEPLNIIFFAEGIPAFEDEKEFLIFPVAEASPFFYLKSAHSELCLVIADPFAFFPDYEVDLPEALLDDLEVKDGLSNLMVFIILTLGADFKDTTANLLAPVIVNAQSRKGNQFIPQKSEYSARQPLFAKTPDKEGCAGQGRV